MPKFYVQSDQVQIVLDTQDARQAAITAFQWWCDQQAEAVFSDDVDACQLGNTMHVSETGFDTADADTFPTLDILMAWQAGPVEIR
jgi:hypothetical protein